MLLKEEFGDRFRTRLFVIWLVYSGHTVEDAASMTGVSRATGYNIQKRWNSGGPDALRPQSIPGRPPKMTNEQKERIRNILAAEPMETKNIRSLIKQEYGIDYSVKQVHIILIKMGFHHEKPDVVRQGRFKDRANMVWTL